VNRYTTRLATVDDTEFLWKMLYYASHSDEDGVTDAEALKSGPERVGGTSGIMTLCRRG
jgi:hypothetical protein